MRITTGMIQNQVVFNMQRSISRFMKLQTDMSSGRRINRPSDDPTGTIQDLGYRTELDKNAQYQKNTTKALGWMSTYDTTLSDMSNYLTSAKEIAVAMANGNYDDVARNAEAKEIESILQQMMQLGNTEHEGRRIFAGYKTDVKPFELSANGVSFLGDSGEIKYEVEASVKMTINMNGADVLLQPLRPLGEDSDLNVGIVGSTLLGELNAGSGIDLAAGTFTITDNNLGVTATVDLTGAPPLTDTNTVDDLLARINADLAANVPPMTGVTAVIGEAGNNIAFDTVQTGTIAGVTPLLNLNSGNGIDLNPGMIIVSDGAGINESVDLSGAETIDDIITQFNNHFIAAGMPEITMGLNGTATGLEISDANVPPLGLSVNDGSTLESTASDLGLIGSIDPSLVGTDLNPVVSFEIADGAGSTAADLGIVSRFRSDFEGTDLNAVLTADSAIADLQAGNGLDQGEMVIWQGRSSFSVDLSDPSIVTVQDLIDAFNTSGLDITASINADGTGIQIENNDPTQSLTIEDTGEGRAAKELGIYGSSDIMGTLIMLQNALQNDDAEATGLLLEGLDAGTDHLLEYRGAVGSKAIRLETTSSRLLDQAYNFTSLLSEVEDADITALYTELSAQENAYQASLMAGAKIIQPSLMEFLR